MFNKFKIFISQYINVKPIEWEILKARLSVKKFHKGQIILPQGYVCSHLYFINTGLARGYVINDDGKDYTWSIYYNDSTSHMSNLFVIDYNSFLLQKESSIYIEALEECEIISIAYKDVQFMYKHFKTGERLGRLMTEEAYKYLHTLIINRQTKTAKERFEYFMNTTPHLLYKVPQYHIATFLGITPQHLSRLKKDFY